MSRSTVQRRDDPEGEPRRTWEDIAAELSAFNLLYAPGHLLRRNHQRSYELFSRRAGEVLTRQQAALLIALAQRPGASQSELVGETGMDKSTLKELLGRMSARGLVHRERDPLDSRAWKLQIAPEGSRLLADLLPRIEAAQRDILAPLPEADRPIFIRMLRTLIGVEK